jgi:hypothetical protein
VTPDDLAAIEAHAAALPPHRTRGYMLELVQEVRALQERLATVESDAREWEAEAWRVRGERDAALKNRPPY